MFGLVLARVFGCLRLPSPRVAFKIISASAETSGCRSCWPAGIPRSDRHPPLSRHCSISDLRSEPVDHLAEGVFSTTTWPATRHQLHCQSTLTPPRSKYASSQPGRGSNLRSSPHSCCGIPYQAALEADSRLREQLREAVRELEAAVRTTTTILRRVHSACHGEPCEDPFPMK